MLCETFVQIPPYTGTLYKASGWINVGTTKGRDATTGTKSAKNRKRTSGSARSEKTGKEPSTSENHPTPLTIAFHGWPVSTTFVPGKKAIVRPRKASRNSFILRGAAAGGSRRTPRGPAVIAGTMAEDEIDKEDEAGSPGQTGQIEARRD